ncbi:MAG: hypothetical protein ACPGWR_13355 [Ardenticatenaceae bacterium]
MSRKKKTNRTAPIAGGVAGAAFGMLAAALGDSMELLPGAAIGGVLGATAVRLLITATKGQKHGLKVAFPTGRETDFYLNATPLIQKYIKNKVDFGLKVEGRLHFLPNHEFEPLCFDYLLDGLSKGANLPPGKKPIKASGDVSRARKVAQKTNAFQAFGEIYINLDKAGAGTVIHESLHLFQEISYLKDLDVNINEGTTEYFTRLICAKHQITRRPKYPVQHECIKKLVAVCGEDKLAEAYFYGHLSVLESAVDAKKHKGTFQMWIELMKETRFEDANKLL